MTNGRDPKQSIFTPGTTAAGVRYQVRDVERSIAFYTGQLGFQRTQRAGAVFATVSRGDLHLLPSGPASSGSRPMPDGRRQGPGGKQIQLEDPDGNPIELHEAPHQQDA